MHTIEFYASMCKCLLVYGLIHSSLPYKQRTNLYTNKRSSIKATPNSKSRGIEIAAKYRMFTTRSLWAIPFNIHTPPLTRFLIFDPLRNFFFKNPLRKSLFFRNPLRKFQYFSTPLETPVDDVLCKQSP